jgi:homospermidine synthase
MIWAIENPDRDHVEADDMDFQRCLDICTPDLGPVVGAYTDWTPLEGGTSCSWRTWKRTIRGS